jgi:two-component system, sensor histidine kinase FlrB
MHLASAFSEFIAASARLETSYHHLQQEVYELRQQLSARNAALTASMEVNERMRLDLQQILNSMPCGVLVLDGKSDISMINPECGRLLGLNASQFRAAPRSNLRQISALSGINLNQNPSTPETVQEFCVTHASGKRWLEARNRPLFHQTILILRDVTAHRRAEHEREAARTAMALAEITTILAHEVRNPLASLELFAELIENDQAHRSQWISNLRVGIRTLSGTVNNVLTFHGSGLLKLAPVSLSDVIATAIQFVLPLAQQAAVSLEWTPDRHPFLVMGNESALRQVVLNLISNAIRHTRAGGAVTVALCHEHDTVTVEHNVTVAFSDTGCGLRADQIDRIFEPGFSGTGDTSGLGLAVCARIMKQHGGRIAASNLARGGARFVLSLPLLQLEAGTA